MVIKKYLADSEQNAIMLAKEDLGSGAIVMNIKKIEPKGFFRFFMKEKVEVTAAVDDNMSAVPEDVKNNTVTFKSEKKNEKRNEDSFSLKPADRTLEALEKAMRNGELDSVTSKKTENNARKSKKDPDKDVSDDVEEVKKLEKKIDTIQDSLKNLIDDRIKNMSNEKLNAVSQGNNMDDVDNNGDVQRAQAYKELIYDQLVSAEVSPENVKDIIDEIEDLLTPDAAIDRILAVVYQKIVLKLGQPHLIATEYDGRLHCTFFIGPTGVGKTTTIAKIVSDLKLNHKLKVALITADTYRIAAVEQLTTYAAILDIPVSVVYSPDEMKTAIEQYKDYDHVLIDTAGRSHLNGEQRQDLIDLLGAVEEKDVYLTLSITTKYRDLVELAEAYASFTDYSIIFTKLDETSGVGNIYNLKIKTGMPLSYVAYGQNVPDDFSKLDTQFIAKKLLGGRADGSGRKS